MACLAQNIQRYSVTLGVGLTFLDVAITSVSMGRSEVILDVRAGQSTLNKTNMCVTAELTSSTNVRVQRGGNAGNMICNIIIVQYTVASGASVERGTAVNNIYPLNITITNFDRTKRYCRVYMRTVTDDDFGTKLCTYEVLNNNTLQILHNTGSESFLTFVWQVITIGDIVVSNVIINPISTVDSTDITSLGIVDDNTFCVTSMWSPPV